MRINANYDEKNKTGQKDSKGNDVYFEDFRVNDHIVASDFNLLSGQLDITSADTDNIDYQTVRKGKYRLIYPKAQDKILVWKENPDGSYSKIESGRFYSVTLPVHYNLRIEGIKGSQMTSDAMILAQFIPDGSKKGFSIHDAAFLTVIETKFMLTFDDGPMGNHTLNILNNLHKFYVTSDDEPTESHPVKAAFFMVGEDGSKAKPWPAELWEQGSVRNYPATTKAVERLGHYIGNHTQHHQAFDEWDEEYGRYPNQDDVAREINECFAELETALGHQPSHRIFRPPYLINNLVNGGTTKGGAHLASPSHKVIWGFTIGDSNPFHGTEAVRDNCWNDYLSKWNTKENPNRKDRPLILIFHDYRGGVSYPIGEILPSLPIDHFTIIKYLQDHGYVLVDFNPNECMEDKDYYEVDSK